MCRIRDNRELRGGGCSDGPIVLGCREGQDFPAPLSQRGAARSGLLSLSQSCLLSAALGRVTQSLGHFFVDSLPCTPAGLEDTAGPRCSQGGAGEEARAQCRGMRALEVA